MQAQAGLLILLVALLGALAGIGLAVLTDAVSCSGVGDANWSLRGNGAIVVILSGAPAVLVAGWVSLARLRVRDRRWGRAGLVAGTAMFLCGALTGFGPVVVVNMLGEQVLRGTSDSTPFVLLAFGLPVVLALVAGLALATVFAKLSRRSVLYAIGVLIAALLLHVRYQPVLFFYYGPLIVLPLLVGLPVVVGSEARIHPLFSRFWLALACVLLPFGLGGGFTLAVVIQSR